MIILVDAYNMIKQVLRRAEISHAQRIEYISKLRRYANRKKHTLVMVFDGGPYQWVHKEPFGSITVVYSGVHASADEYIKQYLDEHRNADVLLVSDDHELVNHAASLGVPSIAALGFSWLVDDAIAQSTSQALSVAPDISHDTPITDINKLMEQASQVVPIKHEDRSVNMPTDIGRASRGSKIERKLQQILKKL